MADAFTTLSKELKGLAAELRKADKAERPAVRKPARKHNLGAVPKRKPSTRKRNTGTGMPEWLPWVAGFALAGGAVYYFATGRKQTTAPPTAPELLPSAPVTLPSAPVAQVGVLQQGNTGAGVQSLQRLLMAAGYAQPINATGGADGDWGPGTTRALTMFSNQTLNRADSAVSRLSLDLAMRLLERLCPARTPGQMATQHTLATNLLNNRAVVQPC